jgi:DNA-binding NarL/FixJ family response regulator
VATTVVIVDDHPSFRASARAVLEASGFEVIGEAADGSSGCELLRRLRPDVVLLDVQLPDMTGFDVCVECGDLDETSVVLVSSRDGSDFGDLVERCGARGFIAKAELTGDAVTALIS